MSEARLVYSDNPDWRRALGGRWLEQRELHLEQERLLFERARETGNDLPELTRATAAGDRDKLRGIPMTKAGGAIRGTRPGECHHGPKGLCWRCS